MNGFAFFTLASALIMAPASAPSQTYNDPAMSFTAPADYTPLPVPSNAPASMDGPTVVAAYVHNADRTDRTSITLTMQNDTDDLNTFEQTVEQQIRGQGADSVFVRKTLTTLPNGMPAYFQTITIGISMGEVRIFQYCWVDGVRGVTLAVSGRFGAISEKTAKDVLSNVSAVAYPKNRGF